jgi:hypothetical protein
MTGQATPQRKRQRGVRWQYLTDDEVLSIVSNLFVGGMEVERIVTHMRDFYGEAAFNRQHPYAYIRKAGRLGILALARYDGREIAIEQRIRSRFPGLSLVEVASSVMTSDVAERVARSFVEWGRHQVQAGRSELRIGLMGGGTIMAVCRALARALVELPEEEKERWPRLTFQALAVGDNVREPLEDPASFFTYFADPMLTPLRREYIGVHAPVFTSRPVREDNPDAIEFEHLRAEARSSDVVLVSAGAIEDEHSFLGRLQAAAPDSWQRLRAENCTGDLGRLPVSVDGPLPLELFDHPPCTLIGLEDFQNLVRDRRKVMLVVAPCGDCGAHKGDIIQTLLGLRERDCRLFTDLFCDSRSTRNMSVLGTVPPRGSASHL